jgi:hypothetical protein
MKVMNTMNAIKQPYIAPESGRCRIFLEDGIAAKASFMAGSGTVTQTNWANVSDETVGAGTDKQGDIWFSY